MICTFNQAYHAGRTKLKWLIPCSRLLRCPREVRGEQREADGGRLNLTGWLERVGRQRTPPPPPSTTTYLLSSKPSACMLTITARNSDTPMT